MQQNFRQPEFSECSELLSIQRTYFVNSKVADGRWRINNVNFDRRLDNLISDLNGQSVRSRVFPRRFPYGQNGLCCRSVHNHLEKALLYSHFCLVVTYFGSSFVSGSRNSHPFLGGSVRFHLTSGKGLPSYGMIIWSIVPALSVIPSR